MMRVTSAGSSGITLKNGAADLSQNANVEIMGNMHFKVADSDTVRFYPYVKRTIGGVSPTPPTYIPAKDSDRDGVPDTWDKEPDTPDGYRTDSDGRGQRWGDMNRDGRLTSVDAMMLLKMAPGSI